MMRYIRYSKPWSFEKQAFGSELLSINEIEYYTLSSRFLMIDLARDVIYIER